MINKVTLIGHAGGDPDSRTLDTGAQVARVSLATNESYKDKAGEWQTTTEWHNLIMWRDLAERAVQHIKKGSTLYVEGKISYRKYTDKDGVEKTVTDIVVNSFRVLDNAKKDRITGCLIQSRKMYRLAIQRKLEGSTQRWKARCMVNRPEVMTFRSDIFEAVYRFLFLTFYLAGLEVAIFQGFFVYFLA